MALTKRTYVGGTTKITADNLNEIQDSIISLENETLNKTDITDALGYTPAKPSDIPTEDISANTSARHTHSNKTVLDNISGITSVSGGTISGTDSSLATKKALDTMKTQIESDFPTSLKNPKTLTFTGAVSGIYDGSSDLTVNIPSGGSGSGSQGQDGKSVNWRGEYGASTTYNKLDAVSYNGSSYIYSSSTSASGKVPGVDNEWDLMAEKGEDGSPGADGKDGTNGTNGADGSPGIVISSTQPTSSSHPVWLDPDGDASADNPLNLTSALVGQIARISAVDDNGVPTAWEAVDMASGGGEKEWTKIIDVEITEKTGYFDVDSLGGATEFHIRWSALKNDSSSTSGLGISINGKSIASNGFVPSTNVSGQGIYGWTHAKYDGLFWIVEKSAGAINPANNTPCQMTTTYNLIEGVGEANKISIACIVDTYMPTSGKLEVWAR